VGIRRGKQTVYIRQSSLDSATFAHLLDRADVLITDLDRKGMAEIGATLDRIHRGYRTDQRGKTTTRIEPRAGRKHTAVNRKTLDFSPLSEFSVGTT
jgi:hypothetical protein